MSNKINIDYIGVVKESNGKYTFEQMPIIESVELKKQLQAMCKNPNRTLLDMQDALAMGVKNDKRAYSCCLPYHYSSSYIDYVSYPKEVTFDDYQAKIKAHTEKIREDVKNSTSVPDSEKDSEIEKRIKAYEKQLKEAFMIPAIRYIEAMDFGITRVHIKEQSSIKMMSHEFIGWTILEYKINEDLTITVRTNFGYGSSSYFFVNVCYKGIDLLPYAATVNYYYANMQDIIAYTRNYQVKRESWQKALYEVADWSDKTKAGIEQFAYEWLQNEITEMMDGLQYIKRTPRLALDDIVKKGSSDQDSLVSVRNISADETKIYSAYPDELALVFKVEKISNALRLLTKLKEASIIYEEATQAIEDIKELNIAILPEIQKAVERLNIEITNKKQELVQTKCELEEAEEKKAPMSDKLEEIFQWLKSRKNNMSWDECNKLEDRLRKSYIKKYPEYAITIKHIKKLSELCSNIKNEIRDRKMFMTRLQVCQANITKAGLLAA